MAISFRLPTINADSATLLNTPVAATDVVLDNGVLTILDESGAQSLVLKASDLINFNYAATSNGTANAVDVDLTGVVIVNNGVYSLTISAPYAVNFFGGGQETNAIFQTRTYTVSLDASATVTELQTLLIARINADVNNYFSAASQAGDVIRITADAAGFGPLTVVAPALAVVSQFTAWASPVGTTNEVLQYIPNAALVTGTYNRYIITHRKFQRSNIVNGLQVVRPVQSIVYLDSTAAGTAATELKLTGILSGAYTPVADYLGCPAV
ncbi:MAG: hypothetical protein RL273_1001 [Bacteroidota bacterium]